MSKYIPASEFCNTVTDGTHDSPKRVENGVKLITSKNIIGGNLDLSSAYFISEIDANNINKRSKVDINDVLISMIGTVGEVCLINEEPNFVIKNVGLFKNSDRYKATWLYFYLRSHNAQNLIKERLKGTTQQYLSLGELRRFPILMPKNDKHLINAVDFLWDLEQKIALNTQINQTLEQIAQATFKSWFIDFEPVHAKATALAEGQSPEQATFAAMTALSGKTPEQLHRLQTENPTAYDQLHTLAEAFPSEFEEVEGGIVPKGWEINKLSKFGEIICGKTPSKSISEYYGNDISFIKIPDMHNQVFIINTIDNLSISGAASQAKKYIKEGSVCVSCIATVGLVSITSKISQTNQQINSIIPFKEIYSKYLYLLLSQKTFKEYLIILASGGTATLNLNTKKFSGLRIIKPDDKVLVNFDNSIKYIFNRILENTIENNELSKTRDLLLPKLLNGEINL